MICAGDIGSGWWGQKVLGAEQGDCDSKTDVKGFKEQNFDFLSS